MEWLHGVRPGPVPDSMVFRLHYRTTVFLFLILGLVLGFLQVFGEPIHCQEARSVMDKSFLQNYCWNSLLDEVSVARQDGYQAHPGISRDNSQQSRSFAYIKTLPLLFIFQSLLFYVTHYLWKLAEGGLLDRMSHDLKAERNSENVNYFEKGFGKLGSCALLFILMEFLNVLNTFSNFVYIDRLMDHQFWQYGWKVSKHLAGLESDPRQSVFPREFRCQYNKFGPSGAVERHDIFCILSWSFLMETLLLFVWGWLIVLLGVSVLSVLYRLLTFCSTALRFRLLRSSAVGLLVPEDQLVRFVSSHSLGSWFMVLALSENVPPSSLVRSVSDKTDDDNDSILESIVSTGKE